ncbi:hypothetical protein FOA24_24020 [Bacillus thuringiensis]|uniref:hypothetical protein n=1 Tax=Bacillus thuringiensis TaxID=1428 RepID=UPI0033359AA4
MMKKFHFRVREGANPLGPRIDFNLPAGETLIDYPLYETDGTATGIHVILSLEIAELGSTVIFKATRQDGSTDTFPYVINRVPYLFNIGLCDTTKLAVSASGPLKGYYQIGGTNFC